MDKIPDTWIYKTLKPIGYEQLAEKILKEDLVSEEDVVNSDGETPLDEGFFESKCGITSFGEKRRLARFFAKLAEKKGKEKEEREEKENEEKEKRKEKEQEEKEKLKKADEEEKLKKAA